MCVLLLLLAGCGGGGSSSSSKPLKGAAYVNRVNAIANGLDAAANNLSAGIDSPTSVVTALVGARAALRKAGRQLGAITPPPAIKGPHERLVRAVDELADDLTSMIANMKTGRPGAIDQGPSLNGEHEARSAIAAITKAGYKIQIPLLS